MKKLFIFTGIVLALIVLALALLWSNLDAIIKKGIETAGPRILQAPVTVAKVEVKATEGRGVIEGLVIGNPQGFTTDYAFKLGRIGLELDPASLTSDTIRIKSIVIQAPEIIYEGLLGKSNLEQLQANALAFTKAGQQQPAGAGKKKVVIDQLRIENGSISLSAALLQGKKLTVPLPTIELKDIGKNKEATMADALSETLRAINRAALPAAQKGLASLGDGLKAVGEAAREGAEKGLEGLKGLFGK